MVISPTIVKPACVVMVSMVVAGEVFILDAGMEVDDNGDNDDNDDNIRLIHDDGCFVEI